MPILYHLIPIFIAEFPTHWIFCCHFKQTTLQPFISSMSICSMGTYICDYILRSEMIEVCFWNSLYKNLGIVHAKNENKRVEKSIFMFVHVYVYLTLQPICDNKKSYCILVSFWSIFVSFILYKLIYLLQSCKHSILVDNC